MPRSTRPLAVVAAILTVAFEAQAARVARFYLEHTISRQAHGPILNQPGYRFQIGTDGYVVLAAKPGQILFSTYPQTQYLGPYDLEQDRIVDLGSQAYTIVRLDSIEQQEIPAHIPVRPREVPPAPEAVAPTAVEIPTEPWTWDTSSWPFSAMVWAEPFRSTKYDWTLGGYTGERASDIESTRLGSTLFWGNWSLTLGLSMNAEQADSVIPSNASVSDLRLDGGSGFLAALGYTHRIRLDRRWNALVGGTFEYRDESFDMTATTLTQVPVEAPIDPVPTDTEPAVTDEEDVQTTHVYETATSDASMSEYLLTVSGGIEYEADAWGSRLEILLSALDDTSVDASVMVLDREYLLSGTRSHPVSIALTGWGYVLEGVRLEAQLSAGAETALRVGAAYEW
jgi:hypothetical protein